MPQKRRSWSRGGQNFLNTAHDAVLEHYLDSVGMVRRLREDFLHRAFGQLAGSLILLFDDPDAKSRPYVGASLSVHSDNYFFGVTFVTVRPMASAA